MRIAMFSWETLHSLAVGSGAVFAFAGDGEMQSQLKNRTRQLGIGHAVHWLR